MAYAHYLLCWIQRLLDISNVYQVSIQASQSEDKKLQIIVNLDVSYS
jgi:hypothetical protein